MNVRSRSIANAAAPAIVLQILIALVALAAAPDTATAQLAVTEVCTVASTACVAPGNKPAIRRGMTETIKVKGPFTDLTQRSGVTTGSPGSVHIDGAASCGSQCLSVTVRVDSDHSLSMRLVPIFLKNAFGATAFNAFIVRKGEITAMSQLPELGVWGQPVQVTISGNDIGDTRAAVSQSDVSNHVEAAGSGFGTTTFRVIATGTQTTTSTGVTLGDDAVAGIPGNYRFTVPKRTVNYRAATSAGCATTPGITAPSLVSPANGQIFTFPTNPVQGTITLRWGAPAELFKANEQYIVETRPVNGATTSVTLGEGITQRTVMLNRNTTYQWRVRALNCGVGSPFSPYGQFILQ